MPTESEIPERSKKHQETFVHTGKGREEWNLSKLSRFTVGASTEIPRDIVEKMDIIGPMLVQRKIIPSPTNYAVMRYCIMAKLVAFDQFNRKLLVPDRALIDEMKWKRTPVNPAKTKGPDLKRMYPTETVIPMNTGIPTIFGKLAEQYAPIMKELNLLKSEATPYAVWQYCCISTILELWNQWVVPHARP